MTRSGEDTRWVRRDIDSIPSGRGGIVIIPISASMLLHIFIMSSYAVTQRTTLGKLTFVILIRIYYAHYLTKHIHEAHDSS